MIIFFKETRGSILLSRKAKALNAYYKRLEAAGYYGVAMPSEKEPGHTEIQRIRWKVLANEERDSIGGMISISLYRFIVDLIFLGCPVHDFQRCPVDLC